MKLEDNEVALLKDALMDSRGAILRQMGPSHVRNGWLDALQTLCQKCDEAFGIDTDYIQEKIKETPRDFFENCDCPECTAAKVKAVSSPKKTR